MFNDGDVITKVWMLLDIIHKAATAGPAYAKWAQMAQDELGATFQTFTAADPELPLTDEEHHDDV